MGDQVPRGKPATGAAQKRSADHTNTVNIHVLACTKGPLPHFVNIPAPWALIIAVGSYTENRGLNQGAASSTGGADGDDEPNKKYWFLNIRRYRRFFNVDTEVDLYPNLVYAWTVSAPARHLQYQSSAVLSALLS